MHGHSLRRSWEIPRAGDGSESIHPGNGVHALARTQAFFPNAGDRVACSKGDLVRARPRDPAQFSPQNIDAPADAVAGFQLLVQAAPIGAPKVTRINLLSGELGDTRMQKQRGMPASEANAEGDRRASPHGVTAAATASLLRRSRACQRVESDGVRLASIATFHLAPRRYRRGYYFPAAT